MIRGPVCAEPRRLADSDDRAARLLRDADRAFRQGLAAGPAWQRLQARRQRRKVLPFAAAATVLAIAVGALGLVARAELAQRLEPSAVSLAAERLPLRTLSAPVSPLPTVEPSPPPVPTLHTIPSAASTQSLRPSSRPRDEVMTETVCRRWSSQARYEPAVDCFLAISREPGLSAEVALYEAARVSAEGLLDPQRFPNSVLRVEVEWLRVRSLERTGRLAEALASSEALLDSAAARALAPKLHLLRGRIYADAQQDCTHAVQEYVALLGEPGAAGDEAELRRAQCLETLGRASDARLAYERYLARPEPQSGALARERLLTLSNHERPAKGEP
jgi:hypothetical protein